jgi:hypothetical protein
MRRLLLIAAAVIGTALVANTASAQVDTHHGFYASVGGGYGAQTTSIDDGGGDTFSLSSMETAWYAGLGWGVKPQWAFGIDYNYQKAGCGECGGGVHFTNSFYTAAATWYPHANNNFYLKLNLGYATGVINEDCCGNSTQNGFAAGIGFGYDWAMGKGGFIVKPFASYLAQVSNSSYNDASDFGGAKGRAQLLTVGVALGYKH